MVCAVYILFRMLFTNFYTILDVLLQTYVTSPDQEFAAATIQAIGRCASNIDEITDACLNGLVSLLSNRNGKSFSNIPQQALMYER